MVASADELKRITTVARSQSIGADYRKALRLSDEPEVVEFKEVPDVPEELDAELMQTQARIALLSAGFELNIAAARLARAIGVRSLWEIAR